MARPRKQAPERQDRFVSFRVTEDEAAHIEARAAAAGLSVSAYAREQARRGRVVIRQSRGLDAATLETVRRLGVNLNQITRSLHERGGREPPELADLCRLIGQVLDRGLADDPAHR